MAKRRRRRRNPSGTTIALVIGGVAVVAGGAAAAYFALATHGSFRYRDTLISWQKEADGTFSASAPVFVFGVLTHVNVTGGTKNQVIDAAKQRVDLLESTVSPPPAAGGGAPAGVGLLPPAGGGAPDPADGDVPHYALGGGYGDGGDVPPGAMPMQHAAPGFFLPPPSPAPRVIFRVHRVS